MFTKDTLSQLKQLKQDIKASRNLAIGTVKSTANKFGFVTMENGKDVYLAPEEMLKVLHGDEIEIEVKKNDKGKSFGEVERLIKSPTKKFFGIIVEKGKAVFVDPDIPGISRWIFIPPNARKSAKAGDLVECKLSQHPIKTGKPQASVSNVIGNSRLAGVERLYALNKHGINERHSKAIYQIAQNVTEENIGQLCNDRKDLSQIPFVTIDAKSTTDMDDALWAEETENGWTLKVAIADPSAVLGEEESIINALISRTSSVYLPGYIVPMLPENISSELCSLIPEHKRLAKLANLAVSNSGEVTKFEITEVCIQNHQKLSYQEAADFLDGQSEDKTAVNNEAIAKSLRCLQAVSTALNANRAEHALIPSYRKEYYLELNDEQKIAAIKPKQQTSAHKLVEECMVAVNKGISNWLAEQRVASLFVSQPGVRLDRKEAIQRAVNAAYPNEPIDLDNLSAFKDFIRSADSNKNEEQAYLATMVSKQLERSKPSLSPLPHFGLGFDNYLTFTSPLRKASDYLVHSQVGQLLKDQKPTPLSEQIAEEIETKQQAIRSSIYETEQWLKCQYVEQLEKQSFSARIQRVISSGFFVRLNENGIEGFVTTKDMEGKYSFDPDLLTLKGKNAEYRLDQEVNVTLKEVDWGRKQIHFSVTPSA